MDTQTLSLVFVACTFMLYIGIAVWSRAGSTKEFYVAGGGVPPLLNGMATAADWMSAASFLSLAGIVAFSGRDASVFILGWTGGYVLLALLLAPYLRKFGRFTVPEFIGDRYYSDFARVVAILCLIFISFTYIAGQMRGVGIVFSRFLEVDINTGVYVGMAIVFCYAVLGGMKGITYTQVAQYCVLIFAFLVPAVFLSILWTNNPIPQLGLGSQLADGSGLSVLEKLDQVTVELGFSAYTASTRSSLDALAITAALMIGTAGLPHVIVRFFTVPKVTDARKSAGYALMFICVLYTTVPAVAAFSRLNLSQSVNEVAYSAAPSWVSTWENTGLFAWQDKNNDGVIQYGAGAPFVGKPDFNEQRGVHGQRLLNNAPSEHQNEIYVDRDIMVLANPEIANMPSWVVALMAAGAVAAALSTAAGLLLVISSSISHDLLKRTLKPDISDKQELLVARCSAAAAICVAGYFGIHPPSFVVQTVALAFGLAAATLFPAIFLGIFSKRSNNIGAIAGMLVGLLFTAGYIVYFTFIAPENSHADNWLLGISPLGIGAVGCLLNILTTLLVSRLGAAPPQQVQDMIDDCRIPSGAQVAHQH
ncbi:cation acetate symporter [Dasania sp. GY-MA-18]|uniref:Cation acetate symporter n=1 Tax=Dasania phycosphaerae TaxID=2950436 RepID=A0A9J6RGU4_9GAMM|nr:MULTISPECIES: sodium:solute symporter family protein [Dasania]MCR8921450.1 cation acetate symporter [Dasania sp. GY-MA-18]MCZ0863878.1 cation acetate symporter [Dasania phycosphaerae]MCZ0867606.1 cation acetate symporter [Dasania phycosphaerae]